MRKFITNKEAVRFLDIKKGVGKKIVFTNGCFDIIHIGHIRYLKQAISYGDYLIVAINSDESIKKIKGDNRPIIKQDQRAEVLSSLDFITYVTIFDESTPINLIEKIKPDFLVKGSDWKYDEIVGKDFVESYGGKVVRVNLTEGISTTSIIERIIMIDKIRELRNKTGMSTFDCRRILIKCNGDINKSIEYMRKNFNAILL